MKPVLKSYPAYKASDLPWLTKLPAHWRILRGKYLFDCIDVRSKTGSEELLTVSAKYGVIPRKSAVVTMFKAASYVGYKLCWPGDLVINSLWAWAYGLGVSQFHGITSSAYGVYRLKPGVEIDAAFVHELVRSVPFQWELQVRSKGIWISRLQLTDESFLDAPFPLPSLEEQTAIVRYLNYTDGRIRRYISAKQKLIKLLEEQRQIIINRVVTMGINPDVHLKPSGETLLGDVPAYWNIVRLRFLSTKTRSGVTPLGGSMIYQREGVPFLRSQNIHFGGLKLEDVAHIPIALHEQLKATHVLPGDVLLNITGASIGRVCSVPKEFNEGNVNQHVCIIRPKITRILPEYLAAYLSTPYVQQEINIEQNGASRQGLTYDCIRAIKILLPPLEEQKQIVKMAQEQSQSIFSSINDVEREINFLREYRTSLIAAVVTGKIDVREVAAKLPEESNELELPDEVDATVDSEEDATDDLDITLEET